VLILAAITLWNTLYLWYVILTLCPPLEVIRLLEDSSERATRLRQNSPFVSLLSEDEKKTWVPVSVFAAATA
jgi:hypothetical protein